jgi:membrane protein required for colicin V production
LLIVFDKLNSTIPFVNKENTEDSILYEPVKNLAPMIFPNFLSVENDDETPEV